jgi:hypothetical protein
MTYCQAKLDVRYGPHPRNTLDIWLAVSDAPTPLVVFYHGGSFEHGDKRFQPGSPQFVQMQEFLSAGISFASVNYRYHDDLGNSRGVLGSLRDGALAIQFIRSMANDWNIDPDRIGAYGKSAGAGTALWIAFHQDMALANPPSGWDWLAESTRLKVVGAFATQATYDIVQWPRILEIPAFALLQNQSFVAYVLDLYNLTDVGELFSPAGRAMRSEADILNGSQWSAPHPPAMYVSNKMPAGPVDPCDTSQMNHHQLHAKELARQAEAHNIVEAQVIAPAMNGPFSCLNPVPEESFFDFFSTRL